MGQLTEIDLDRFAGEWLANSPDSKPTMTQYVVACEILGALVGQRWTLRMINATTADPYFKQGSLDGSGDRKIGQSRLTEVARHLYVLQECDGFEQLIRHLQSREMVGASAELLAAYLFHSNGHDVRFVEPTGRRGDDFDQVVTVGSTPVSLEVKAKLDETNYGANTLTNSLRKARAQLPERGPGLIVLRIPMHWPWDERFVASVANVVDGFLRGTRRVNAVLLIWDELFVGPDTQFAITRRFRWFPNAEPAHSLDGIEGLIAPVPVLTNPQSD